VSSGKRDVSTCHWMRQGLERRPDPPVAFDWHGLCIAGLSAVGWCTTTPVRESTSIIQCVLVTETNSPGIGAEASSAPAGVTCVTDRPRTNLVTRHLPDMVVARARHGVAEPSGATNSARQTQSVSRTECDRVESPLATQWRAGGPVAQRQLSLGFDPLDVQKST